MFTLSLPRKPTLYSATGRYYISVTRDGQPQQAVRVNSWAEVCKLACESFGPFGMEVEEEMVGPFKFLFLRNTGPTACVILSVIAEHDIGHQRGRPRKRKRKRQI